jgi:hypothetical protein
MLGKSNHFYTFYHEFRSVFTMHTSESSASTSERISPTVADQHTWREHVTLWRKTLLAVLPLFIITRILFLLLTYVGGVLFPALGGSSFALTPSTMLYSWYHADALRLMTIATTGYPDQSYTGFFPLYPALVHIMSTLLHRDILSTGIIIANLAFLGALIFLYRLLEREFNTGIARRGVLYLAFFPTAFFTFNAYDISLLLFFTTLCCYLLRHQLWLAAGLAGGLAALTDLAGVLLFFVFLYEFVWQHFDIYRTAWREKKIGNTLWLSVMALSSLLILLGVGAYCYALEKQLRDPFAFLHPQGNALTAPWITLWSIPQAFFSNLSVHLGWVNALLELVLFLGAIALLVLFWRGPERMDRPQRAFTSFGILLLLYTLLFPNMPGAVASASDPVPALQTLLLLFFSGFIMLAHLGRNKWFHYSYLALSTLCLILLVFYFFQSTGAAG